MLGAVAPHDLGDLRVVRVRHPREQVVLDLEVEAAEHPGQHRVARAEVDGRLDLVHGPDPAARRASSLRRGERCLLDAVGELERRCHDQARDHREADVGAEDGPPRVDEQRDHDRPGDEERLADEHARRGSSRAARAARSRRRGRARTRRCRRRSASAGPSACTSARCSTCWKRYQGRAAGTGRTGRAAPGWRRRRSRRRSCRCGGRRCASRARRSSRSRAASRSTSRRGGSSGAA